MPDVPPPFSPEGGVTGSPTNDAGWSCDAGSVIQREGALDMPIQMSIDKMTSTTTNGPGEWTSVPLERTGYMEWTDEARDWVEALASGLYVQGAGKLVKVCHTGDEQRCEFCCLGVGGAVLGTLVPSTDKRFAQAQSLPHRGGITEYLDVVTARRLGFRGSDEAIHDMQKTLASMNDTNVPFAITAKVLTEAYDRNTSPGRVILGHRGKEDDIGTATVGVVLYDAPASLG